MTPLQLLLVEKKIPVNQIVLEAGKDRTTIWRWMKGISYPHPIDDVPNLLILFKDYSLTLQGCYQEDQTLSNFSDERKQDDKA